MRNILVFLLFLLVMSASFSYNNLGNGTCQCSEILNGQGDCQNAVEDLSCSYVELQDPVLVLSYSLLDSPSRANASNKVFDCKNAVLNADSWVAPFYFFYPSNTPQLINFTVRNCIIYMNNSEAFILDAGFSPPPGIEDFTIENTIIIDPYISNTPAFYDNNIGNLTLRNVIFNGAGFSLYYANNLIVDNVTSVDSCWEIGGDNASISNSLIDACDENYVFDGFVTLRFTNKLEVNNLTITNANASTYGLSAFFVDQNPVGFISNVNINGNATQGFYLMPNVNMTVENLTVFGFEKDVYLDGSSVYSYGCPQLLNVSVTPDVNGGNFTYIRDDNNVNVNVNAKEIILCNITDGVITLNNVGYVDSVHNGLEVISSNNLTFTGNMFNVTGIEVYDSSNITFSLFNLSPSKYGIDVGSSDVKIENSVINSRFDTIRGSSMNVIVNNSLLHSKNGSVIQDDVFGGSSIIITNSNLISDGYYLLYEDASSSFSPSTWEVYNNYIIGNSLLYLSDPWGNNYLLIYNNIINTTNPPDDNGRVDYNVSLTPSTNIVGGPFIGGNYWTNPTQSGFSDTCSDNNNDGICDSSYTLPSGNVDYYPLTTYTGGGGGGSSGCSINVTSDYLLTTDLVCAGDPGLIVKADNIVIDCNNHSIDNASYAVWIENRRNITLLNCNLLSNTKDVFVNNSTHIHIENINGDVWIDDSNESAIYNITNVFFQNSYYVGVSGVNNVNLDALSSSNVFCDYVTATPSFDNTYMPSMSCRFFFGCFDNTLTAGDSNNYYYNLLPVWNETSKSVCVNVDGASNITVDFANASIHTNVSSARFFNILNGRDVLVKNANTHGFYDIFMVGGSFSSDVDKVGVDNINAFELNGRYFYTSTGNIRNISINNVVIYNYTNNSTTNRLFYSYGKSGIKISNVLIDPIINPYNYIYLNGRYIELSDITVNISGKPFYWGSRLYLDLDDSNISGINIETRTNEDLGSSGLLYMSLLRSNVSGIYIQGNNNKILSPLLSISSSYSEIRNVTVDNFNNSALYLVRLGLGSGISYIKDIKISNISGSWSRGINVDGFGSGIVENVRLENLTTTIFSPDIFYIKGNNITFDNVNANNILSSGSSLKIFDFYDVDEGVVLNSKISNTTGSLVYGLVLGNSFVSGSANIKGLVENITFENVTNLVVVKQYSPTIYHPSLFVIKKAYVDALSSLRHFVEGGKGDGTYYKNRLEGKLANLAIVDSYVNVSGKLYEVPWFVCSNNSSMTLQNKIIEVPFVVSSVGATVFVAGCRNSTFNNVTIVNNASNIVGLWISDVKDSVFNNITIKSFDVGLKLSSPYRETYDNLANMIVFGTSFNNFTNINMINITKLGLEKLSYQDKGSRVNYIYGMLDRNLIENVSVNGEEAFHYDCSIKEAPSFIEVVDNANSTFGVADDGRVVLVNCENKTIKMNVLSSSSFEGFITLVNSRSIKILNSSLEESSGHGIIAVNSTLEVINTTSKMNFLSPPLSNDYVAFLQWGTLSDMYLLDSNLTARDVKYDFYGNNFGRKAQLVGYRSNVVVDGLRSELRCSSWSADYCKQFILGNSSLVINHTKWDVNNPNMILMYLENSTTYLENSAISGSVNDISKFIWAKDVNLSISNLSLAYVTYRFLETSGTSNVNISNSNILLSLSPSNIVFVIPTGSNLNISMTNTTLEAGTLVSSGGSIVGKVWNNYIKVNSVGGCGSSLVLWNTTKTPSTNIVGGPFIGGNYWTNPTQSGFSDTCSDTDGDLICDSSYTLPGSCGIDYLPLMLPSNTTLLSFDPINPITLDVGTNTTINITLRNKGGRNAENVSLNVTCPSNTVCYFLNKSVNITNRSAVNVTLFLEVLPSFISSSFTYTVYANDSFSNATEDGLVDVNQPLYQIIRDNATIYVNPGSVIYLNFTTINVGDAHSPNGINYTLLQCPSTMVCNLLYNSSPPLAVGGNNTTVVEVQVPLTASSGYVTIKASDGYRYATSSVYVEVITGFRWLPYSANVSINTTTAHNLTLVNDDSSSKTLNLSVSYCPSSWGCSLNQSSIILPPNSEANVTLTITVPFSETANQRHVWVKAEEYSRSETLSILFGIYQPMIVVESPPNLTFIEGVVNNYTINISNRGKVNTSLTAVSLEYPTTWECNVTLSSTSLPVNTTQHANVSCFVPSSNVLTYALLNETATDGYRIGRNSTEIYLNIPKLVWVTGTLPLLPRNKTYTVNLTLLNNGTSDATDINILATTEQYVTATLNPAYIALLPAGDNVTVQLQIFVNYSLDKNETVVLLDTNYSNTKSINETLLFGVKKPLLILSNESKRYAAPSENVVFNITLTNIGTDEAINLTPQLFDCPFGWSCNVLLLSNNLNVSNNTTLILNVTIPSTALPGVYDIKVSVYESLEGKRISETNNTYQIEVYVPVSLQFVLPQLEDQQLSFSYDDVVLFDIDGDEDLDIIGVNESGVFVDYANINDIHNVSYSPPLQLIGSFACDVAVGDVDNNGKVNIVIGTKYSTLENWEWNGSAFSIIQNISLPLSNSQACSVSLLDADNDSYLEAAVWFDNSSGLTNIYIINASNAGFSNFYLIASASNPDLAVADMDNDGYVDLIAGDDNAQVMWFRNNYNTSFQFVFVQAYQNANKNSRVFVCALQPMLNGSYVSVASLDSKPELEIFLNEGGFFSNYVWKDVYGNNPKGIACGDIDKDGDIDIVTIVDNETIIYYNHLGGRKKEITSLGSLSIVNITFANPYFVPLENVLVEDYIDSSKLSYIPNTAYIIDYDGVPYKISSSDVVVNGNMIVFKNILSYLPSSKLPFGKDKYFSIVYNVSHLSPNPWINIYRAYINYTLPYAYTPGSSYLLSDQINNNGLNPNIINPLPPTIKGRDFTKEVLTSFDFVALNITVFDASARARGGYFANASRNEITIGKDLSMNATIKNNGTADGLIVEVAFYVDGFLAGANRVLLNSNETKVVALCHPDVLTNTTNYVTNGGLCPCFNSNTTCYPYQRFPYAYWMINDTGVHNFSISVDPRNLQIEPDENNNNLSMSINITQYANISMSLNNVLDFAGRDVRNVTVYDDTIISLNFTLNNTGNYDADVFVVPVMDLQLNDPYENITVNSTSTPNPMKFFVSANNTSTHIARDEGVCIEAILGDNEWINVNDTDLILPISTTPYTINVSLYTYGNYPSFPVDNDSAALYGGSVTFNVIPSPADLSLGNFFKYRHTMPYELATRSYNCVKVSEGRIHSMNLVSPNTLEVCAYVYNLGSSDGASTLRLYIDSLSNEVNNTSVFVPARSNALYCLNTSISPRATPYDIIMRIDPLSDEPNNVTNYASHPFFYRPANIRANIKDVSDIDIAEDGEILYVVGELFNDGDVNISSPFNVSFYTSAYEKVEGIVEVSGNVTDEVNISLTYVDGRNRSDGYVYLPSVAYINTSINTPISISVPLINARYGEIMLNDSVISGYTGVNVSWNNSVVGKNEFDYIDINVPAISTSGKYVSYIKVNFTDEFGEIGESTQLRLVIYVDQPKDENGIVFRDNFEYLMDANLLNYRRDITTPIFIQNVYGSSVNVTFYANNGWMYANFSKHLKPFEFAVVNVSSNFSVFAPSRTNVEINGLNAGEVKYAVGNLTFGKNFIPSYSKTYLYFGSDRYNVSYFISQPTRGLRVYMTADPQNVIAETKENDNGGSTVVNGLSSLEVNWLNNSLRKGAYNYIAFEIRNRGYRDIRLGSIVVELWNDTSLIDRWGYGYVDRGLTIDDWVYSTLSVSPLNKLVINDTIYIPKVSGNLKFKVKLYPTTIWFYEGPYWYKNLGEKPYFGSSNRTYVWKGGNVTYILINLRDNNNLARKVLVNGGEVAFEPPQYLFFDITDNLTNGVNLLEVTNNSSSYLWSVWLYKKVEFEEGVNSSLCQPLTVKFETPPAFYRGKVVNVNVSIDNNCDAYNKVDGFVIEAYNQSSGEVLHHFKVVYLGKVMSPHEVLNASYDIYIPSTLPLGSKIRLRVYSVKENDLLLDRLHFNSFSPGNAFNRSFYTLLNSKAQSYVGGSYLPRTSLNISEMLPLPFISTGAFVDYNIYNDVFVRGGSYGLIDNFEAFGFYGGEAYVENASNAFLELKSFAYSHPTFCPTIAARTDALYDAYGSISDGYNEFLFRVRNSTLSYGEIVEYKTFENVSNGVVTDTPIDLVFNVTVEKPYYGYTSNITINITNPFNADVTFSSINVEAYNGSSSILLGALTNITVPSNTSKEFNLVVLIPDDIDRSYNTIKVNAYQETGGDYYIVSNVAGKSLVRRFRYPFNGTLVLWGGGNIEVSAFEPFGYGKGLAARVKINGNVILEENRTNLLDVNACGEMPYYRYAEERYSPYYPGVLQNGRNVIEYEVGNNTWDVYKNALRIKAGIKREIATINLFNSSEQDLNVEINVPNNTSINGSVYVDVPITIINNNPVEVEINYIEMELIDGSKVYKYAYYSKPVHDVFKNTMYFDPIVIPPNQNVSLNITVRLPKVGSEKQYTMRIRAYRMIDLGSVFKVSIKQLLENAKDVYYDDTGWRVDEQQDDALHRRVIYTTPDTIGLVVKPFQIAFGSSPEIYVDGSKVMFYNDEEELRKVERSLHSYPLERGRHAIVFLSSNNASLYNDEVRLWLLESISKNITINVKPHNGGVLINVLGVPSLSAPFVPYTLNLTLNNTLGRNVTNYVDVYLENLDTNMSYLVASYEVPTPEGVTNTSINITGFGDVEIVGYSNITGASRVINSYLGGVFGGVNRFKAFYSSNTFGSADVYYGNVRINGDSLVLLMPLYVVCDNGVIIFNVMLNSSSIPIGGINCNSSTTYIGDKGVIIARKLATLDYVRGWSSITSQLSQFEGKPLDNYMYYVVLYVNDTWINKTYDVKVKLLYRNMMFIGVSNSCNVEYCGNINMSSNNSVVISARRLQEHESFGVSKANIVPLSSALSSSYLADYWAIDELKVIELVNSSKIDPPSYYRYEMIPRYDTSEIVLARGSKVWINNNLVDENKISTSSFVPNENNILVYSSTNKSPFFQPIQQFYTPVIVSFYRIYAYEIDPNYVSLRVLRGTPVEVNFTITNTGTEPLTINLSLNESFATLNESVVTLLPGEQKEVKVTIDTSLISDGNYSILLLGNESFAGERNATIDLEVLSIRICAIRVYPSSLNFGSLSFGNVSSEEIITVENIGNVPGNISVNATDWYSNNSTWDVNATRRSNVLGVPFALKQPLDYNLQLIGEYAANSKFNDYVQVVAPYFGYGEVFKQNVTYYIDCG